MDISCSKSLLLNYSLHNFTLLSCFRSPEFSSVYWAMLLRIEYISLNYSSFVETKMLLYVVLKGILSFLCNVLLCNSQFTIVKYCLCFNFFFHVLKNNLILLLHFLCIQLNLRKFYTEFLCLCCRKVIYYTF